MMLNTIIPVSNLLNEATFYGKPLCLYKIDSKGALAYLDLAYELITMNSGEEEFIKIKKEEI